MISETIISEKEKKKDKTFKMKMSRGGGGGSNKKKSTKDETFKAATEEVEKKGLEGGEGKTIVVGVRMDSQSRELLTWALVKVAVSGDRVVALHVLSSSSFAAAAAASGVNGDEQSALVSLAKEFDPMLAVYEGFCNLKQIELKLKICKGSSIRKVLVREANAFTASKLILGVTKNCRSIGPSPISIAKYCSKKLPSSCSVIALSNGKIVFQKEAADNIKCQKRCCKDSTKGAGGEDGELYCLLPIVGVTGLDAENSSHSITPKHVRNGSTTAASENVSSSINASPRTNCLICNREADPPSVGESRNEDALALVPVDNTNSPSSPSSSPAVKKLQVARPDWPFIRRLLLNNRKIVSSDKTKTSVAPWGMQLRCQHSSVHPDRKTMKSDGNVLLNLDNECGTIVPHGAELSLSSFLADNGSGGLWEELESLKEKYSSVCRLFSYEELMRATSNSSPENLIGKGGSSSVYKGSLSDGKELAFKILKSSEDATKAFLSEIEIITTLHHKNIISLLGFCLESNNLILVYDYLSRGNLEEILHGEKANCDTLSWSDRYKVAIGVAEALDYLHGGGSNEPVIHRDVKSSNILLSEDCEPQLSDFGLAKRASASTAQLTASDKAGTFGYLAPEFFLYGKVNEKTDVYAFGVVLLELLSGRKPISTDGSKGQESLVMWAKPLLQGAKVKELMDPHLEKEYDSDQAERMRLAASLCIRWLNQARPKISLVLKILQGDEEAVRWARLEVDNPEGLDELDEEVINQKSDIQSHINLALLDVEEDLLSICSTDHTVDSLTASTSMEDFLQCRWSRSSSFD